LAEAEDTELFTVHQTQILKQQMVDQEEELILQVNLVQLEQDLEQRDKVLMVETNQDLILFIIQAEAEVEQAELFL
tara:strand:+ start:113 stop:340 length:228 start_codon:yes stop_codon:yes gene_type:complete